MRDETGFPAKAHQVDCPNTSLLREEQENKLGPSTNHTAMLHLISNYNSVSGHQNIRVLSVVSRELIKSLLMQLSQDKTCFQSDKPVKPEF